MFRASIAVYSHAREHAAAAAERGQATDRTH